MVGSDVNGWVRLNTIFFYTFLWYAPSWIFPLLHMVLPVHNGGLASATPWGTHARNDFFYFMMNFVMWVFIAGQHLIFSNPLRDHLEAVNLRCKCDPVEYEDNMGPRHREYVELLAQKECYTKCPSDKPEPEVVDPEIIVEEQPQIGEAGLEVEAAKIDLF